MQRRYLVTCCCVLVVVCSWATGHTGRPVTAESHNYTAMIIAYSVPTVRITTYSYVRDLLLVYYYGTVRTGDPQGYSAGSARRWWRRLKPSITNQVVPESRTQNPESKIPDPAADSAVGGSGLWCLANHGRLTLMAGRRSDESLDDG